MSVQGEIDRIKGNIAEAYTAAGEKGATLPEARDSAGLSRAVQSIPTGVTQEELETALATKQDALTAGDGLSIAGNVASVDTPVRGVVSQADFDALPEAEQNKGLYVVPDAGGGGAGGGGAGGDGGVFLVCFDYSNIDGVATGPTCDKTYQEVLDAIASKKPVIARIHYSNSNNIGTFDIYTSSIVTTGDNFPDESKRKYIWFFIETEFIVGSMRSVITYNEAGEIRGDIFDVGGGGGYN